MGAVSPETWPILVAFLTLQGAITWPLVKYIRAIHEAQIARLEKQVADLTAERDRFIGYAMEATRASHAATSATQTAVAAAERVTGRA